ncbi:MAG: spore germination protein [Lachnospiraceae bacterium]|nr:spore germination protein [Lachnospiraceae bacterium]
MDKLSLQLTENIAEFDRILSVKENYDMLKRVFRIGTRQACFYFIDGFHKDEILQRLLQYYADLENEDTPESLQQLMQQHMPYGELELVTGKEALIAAILSGKPGLLVDGFDTAITVDFRNYPARSVSEPDKDKAMRGSKDGFVETLVFNTALIRRRIRTPEFMIEMLSAGRSSKTDIAVCYMSNRVDKKFLNEIKERINQINVDALTMNQQSLAECLFQGKWIDPFPKFKFSERPDTAAACILEGCIVLLVDNSPAAMILPASIFDIVEEADDYYFPPITGTYLRLSRLFINILALVLTPLFMLVSKNPEYLPEMFAFVAIKDPVNIPLIWQFLILEFMVDGLRLASLNTPNMLSTPLSVISGLVIGEFTVSSGWFNAEAMLYMAFVTIANYTQVNFELGYALKFLRILTIVLTWFFGIWGFAGGLLFAAFAILANRTVAGKSYLYPLIPFRPKEFLRRVVRVSLPNSEKKG